jgi:hypothetical protein
MKNPNFNTALEYFNSITAYGKCLPVQNTECYDIKFCCKIDSARKIVIEFRKTSPNMKDNLLFHVNKDETRVIFGGRFRLDSRAKNFLYDLITKHK